MNLKEYLGLVETPIEGKESRIEELISKLYKSEFYLEGFDASFWYRNQGMAIDFWEDENNESQKLEDLICLLNYWLQEDYWVQDSFLTHAENGELFSLLTKLSELNINDGNIASVKKNIYRTELLSCLNQISKLEEHVQGYAKHLGFRVSKNKVTADVGEMFAIEALNVNNNVKRVDQSKKTNEKCDAVVLLNDKSAWSRRFGKSQLLVEIKTRRNQKGAKYLSGVKPDQFDVLCMVDLKQNYSLNAIYYVDKNEITKNGWLDVKRSRLIFNKEMAFESQAEIK